MGLDDRERRALRPDAQAFDKIVIETVPRYKMSELSGDEWRIHAETKFYRKGKLIHSEGASDVEHAAYLVGARHITACDNALGYFGGIDDFCDQEGCSSKAKVKAKKKFDWSRDGHKSEERSDAYRLFCDEHKQRGDCGLDDADLNYEFLKL